jgi:hypothetical protein
MMMGCHRNQVFGEREFDKIGPFDCRLTESRLRKQNEAKIEVKIKKIRSCSVASSYQ